MALKEELGFKRDFDEPAHEALLNIYYTASMMKKRADVLFGKFGLTDVQFNLMSLLVFQSDKEEGLSQAQISDMMLVNRANITTLVDRMEKAGFIQRTAHSKDRRFNIIKLTANGLKLFKKVEPIYFEEINRLMKTVSLSEMKTLMAILEKVRKNIKA